MIANMSNNVQICEIRLYFFLLDQNYDLLKHCIIYPKNVLKMFLGSNREKKKHWVLAQAQHEN